MPYDFAVSVTPSLADVDDQLATFSDSIEDLSDFWPTLGENLAAVAQDRWPLRRRSGKLRRSLAWTGRRLGRGGIYKSEPSSLTIGTKVFYGFYSQRGTKHQARRPLVHVDEADVGKRLTEWAKGRAEAAGLEVS